MLIDTRTMARDVAIYGKSSAITPGVTVMNDKAIIQILCTVLGFLLAGWMYWVSAVALENGDKRTWMIKMQGQINQNEKDILVHHGAHDHE